jgi:predicted enzyme related to lactoylglutathione lyase
MKRVTGLGGIFFKCKNPPELQQWYKNHLGIEENEHGVVIFEWKDKNDANKTGQTVWAPFPDDTTYFGPGKQEHMINYRVENLVALLEELKKEGVEVVGEIEEYEYGKFGRIMDPEGNKIELWEPA